MNYLKQFEKFVLTAEPEVAKKRMSSIEREDKDRYILFGLQMMYYWFYGRMMGEKGEMTDVVNVFRDLGKVYHDKIQDEKYLYRAVNIMLHKEGMSDADILAITKAETGPKQLQSWSTSINGAKWFFEHFVKEQNHAHKTKSDNAWVIARTEAKNVEQLLTFEDCLNYFSDISTLKLSDDAEDLINHLYVDNMLKLHELIAYSPKQVPIKIVKLLVPPTNKN